MFVQGFDVFDAQSARGVAATRTARAVATTMGKELIEIETNLRVLTEMFGTTMIARGPALAVLGLLLQSQLERIVVPGTQSYRDLAPGGSHPLLDPLWSTEALEVVHDGCEATRAEKVAMIAGSSTALQHLRVCNKQHATQNCAA